MMVGCVACLGRGWVLKLTLYGMRWRGVRVVDMSEARERGVLRQTCPACLGKGKVTK